ncbi:hypothetical protein [Hymenobacter perfusus]|uniref:Uncharacterized protein n=1 Tax=Hymenobacter perfusus TaxID=1236770 RepID=A0A428K3I2_9BACT|nr:hypothetical protein [Hymenobacter perfusus]RSK40951.1 hypothetical protein EI293_18605 [Hymenobacter perfusus]
MKASSIPWLLLLTLAACKKETELDKLPDATQKGKNTAGFLLDGKAWLPEAGKLLSKGGPVSASWQRTVVGRSMTIRFSRDSDLTITQLFIPHIQRSGVFVCNQQVSPILGYRNPTYGMFAMTKSLTIPRLFYTGPTATGSLTVTRFDTVARVVSGTFDLTVQEETSPQTHQLTQGRFDYTF